MSSRLRLLFLAGYSSPVVWGNRAFLTTAVDELPIQRGPALVVALCASLLALTSLVVEHGIDTIYHLGALLSAVAERSTHDREERRPA